MPTTDTILQFMRTLEPGHASHKTARQYSVDSGNWITTKHDLCVIDYVDADGIETRVEGWRDGEKFSRPSGRWHFYAAGTTYHESYARPDRIREDAWVFFPLSSACPALSGRCFAAIEDPEARLLSYVRTMVEHQRRGDTNADLIRHGLFAALIGEIACAANAGGDGSPERPWRVRAQGDEENLSLLAKMDRLLSKRLNDPPSVAEVAAALHLSASGLSHRLKAESGLTVVERIRWLRIREAQKLLTNGISAKEIARRLGFSSPAYFSRVFREVAGVAPQDYLRQREG